jgi:cell division protein FtsB
MTALRQRNDPTRLLWRRLGLLALLVVVCFAGWSVWGAWQKDQESAALDQESQANLQDLSAQQTTLQQNISQLETSRGKEAALRQEYSVGEQGENMIIIVDSSSTPPPPPPTFLDKLKNAFSWW